MKIIRRILLFILVIIIIFCSIFYLNGKKLYDSKISEMSIQDKVSAVRSSENFVSLDSLPKYYKDAVIAVEDHRYYNHGAVDFIALMRALFNNISNNIRCLLRISKWTYKRNYGFYSIIYINVFIKFT